MRFDVIVTFGLLQPPLKESMLFFSHFCPKCDLLMESNDVQHGFNLRLTLCVLFSLLRYDEYFVEVLRIT